MKHIPWRIKNKYNVINSENKKVHRNFNEWTTTVLLSTLICIRRIDGKKCMSILENGLRIYYYYYFGAEAHLSHRFNKI